MTKEEILQELRAIDEVYMAAEQDINNAFSDGAVINLMQLFAVGTNVSTALVHIHKLRVKLEKEMRRDARNNTVRRVSGE